MRPLLLAWAGLLGLLLAQVGTATWLHLPGSASVFGVASSAVVLLVFMQVRRGSGLMRIFGTAGLLWLLVLLGLGNLDPATRTDYPAPITTID